MSDNNLCAIDRDNVVKIAVQVVWGSIGSYETIWSLHGMSLACDPVEDKDVKEELNFLSDLASDIHYDNKMLEIEEKYHAL